jgi:hypothetical protein
MSLLFGKQQELASRCSWPICVHTVAPGSTEVQEQMQLDGYRTSYSFYMQESFTITLMTRPSRSPSEQLA